MKGYVRVTVNGAVYDLSDQIKLDKNKKHSISKLLIDRLTIDSKNNSRLIQSLKLVFLNLMDW
jgi:excinuclease ABC subunit A